MVLVPEDLDLSATDANELVLVLQAYREGDLLGAANSMRTLLPGTVGTNGNLSLLRAALRLALGEADLVTEQLEAAVANESTSTEPTRALRELLATIKGQSVSTNLPLTTASGWLARSYLLQARSDLAGAYAASIKAVGLAPNSGLAWARLAALELSLDQRKSAEKSLSKALAFSPRLAPAVVLQGFIALDQSRPGAALARFDSALMLDGSIGDAWLGRALALGQLGRNEEARRMLQVAAAMEPQRSLIRSYLGQGWAGVNDAERAKKEFQSAKELDPNDPTPWLYSALHREQQNQYNDGVRDLERSIELNDNRSVFRSRLLLDQDRSVRSADLAALYAAIGFSEVGERAASRAVAEDLSNYSGHLFRARSLQSGEDVRRFDLRFETSRQSELLLANLLAPPGAGNLSHQLSQAEHLQTFGPRPLGVSTLTEYGSGGDWSESATFFGQLGGFGYALDSQYRSQRGLFPNTDAERLEFSFQAQQRLTSSDTLYLQAGWLQAEMGDVARHRDPAEIDPGLRVKERQEPHLALGWHHEWAPGHHTLILAERYADRLELRDPDHPLIFVRQSGGELVGVDFNRARFNLSSLSDFTLHSVEVQQLLETPKHALVLGVRYQQGDDTVQARLAGPLPPPLADQRVNLGFERFNTYGYWLWRPWESLRLTAGLAYDRLHYPSNADLPPVSETASERDQVTPKLGLSWRPQARTEFRAAWTRSLGGLYFDNSIRLEPTEVAGFTQSFRSLIPESVVGLVPGTRFETLGIGFDQSWRLGTYAGVSAEVLRSQGEREVGAVSNSLPIPLPDTPTSIRQSLRFEERSVSAYITQLIGSYWATGVRYRMSEANLEGDFLSLTRTAPGVSALNQDETATLQRANLFARFNHSTGFFAQWDTLWFHQHGSGFGVDLVVADFWQHDVSVGYRFPRHHAEIWLGILNLTGQDYRLEALNLLNELPRRRTFTAAVRLNF